MDYSRSQEVTSIVTCSPSSQMASTSHAPLASVMVPPVRHVWYTPAPPPQSDIGQSLNDPPRSELAPGSQENDADHWLARTTSDVTGSPIHVAGRVVHSVSGCGPRPSSTSSQPAAGPSAGGVDGAQATRSAARMAVRMGGVYASRARLLPAVVP